jgi:hypothetical protein
MFEVPCNERRFGGHLLKLRIRHRTTYLYHSAVRLGLHRLMLRPRESRELRLVSQELTVSPASTVTWAHDVFGNAVATASFDGVSDRLVIDSEAVLSLSVEPWPVFEIAAVAISYPFAYSDADWRDLGALVVPQYLDPERQLLAWTKGFVRSEPTDTLSLLKDLSSGVGEQIRYESRESEGTQARLVSGPCSAVRRGSAMLALRRTPVLGLSLSARSGVRMRFHTCLGRGLCARGRVDHLRPDEPQRRWAQLDPGRGSPRNLAGDTGFRQFRWPLRRLSRALGRSQRKASLISLDKASALSPPDISLVAPTLPLSKSPILPTGNWSDGQRFVIRFGSSSWASHGHRRM